MQVNDVGKGTASVDRDSQVFVQNGRRSVIPVGATLDSKTVR
jgi:hypothetical protein